MTIQENGSINKPGGDIDAWCSKCKMILAHTIEAMVGDRPARVHCNTCKAQHAYKAAAPRTAQERSEGKQGETRTPLSARPRASRYKSLLKASEQAAPVAYSTKGTYAEGDVLDHPTFGRGVTTEVKDRTKIVVLFDSGTKTLMHGG